MSELTAADRAALEGNVAGLRERVRAACAAAGRDPGEVALVAVTKYTGPTFARGLLALGQRDLGENRVDHLLDLARGLTEPDPPAPPRWHFVGHLQRNKAKKVADLLDVLHSLDSARLADVLERQRSPGRPPLDVYLQVRLGETEGRSGVAPDAVADLAAELQGRERLRLVGLMGLPPLGAPEEARPHFRLLRELLDVLPPGTPRGLSMGMTQDLEVAVAEGSTCVRVGRALLEGLGEGART